LIARVVLMLVALLAGADSAFAHRLSPAYFGLVESAPNVFDAQWKVSISGGLADALEPQIPDGCALTASVRSYTIEDALVRLGELECATGLRGRELAVDGLPITDTDVLVRIDWLDGASFTHRLVPDAHRVTIPEQSGVLEVAATYTVIGIEHILLGIDHLLFVFALLLLVQGIGRLVATITAFTLAHSITLGAATLGFVQVPSAPVEATIALSILFLATELARARSAPPTLQEDRSLTRRFPWIVAFSFGLLHGFGFAGALSEVGLPQTAIPVALLFFNVGVELGQLAFVGAVLAVAAVLARTRPLPQWSPRLAAYVIGSVAAFWVFERTVTAM
jgi:hypothetical protein